MFFLIKRTKRKLKISKLWAQSRIFVLAKTSKIVSTPVALVIKAESNIILWKRGRKMM